MSSFSKDGNEIDLVAAGGEVVGTVIQGAGTVGIVNPTNDSAAVVAGDRITIRIKGVILVANPDSVDFSTDGTAVGYALATDKATAAAGGDYDIGHCVTALNTATHVAVLLPGPTT